MLNISAANQKHSLSIYDITIMLSNIFSVGTSSLEGIIYVDCVNITFHIRYQLPVYQFYEILPVKSWKLSSKAQFLCSNLGDSSYIIVILETYYCCLFGRGGVRKSAFYHVCRHIIYCYDCWFWGLHLVACS